MWGRILLHQFHLVVFNRGEERKESLQDFGDVSLDVAVAVFGERRTHEFGEDCKKVSVSASYPQICTDLP